MYDLIYIYTFILMVVVSEYLCLRKYSDSEEFQPQELQYPYLEVYYLEDSNFASNSLSNSESNSESTSNIYKFY